MNAVIKLFLIAALVVVAGKWPVCGAETRDPAQNAALQYWMATALTPRISDEDNKTLFLEKQGERLSAVSRKYLGTTSYMPMVVSASSMSYCEWGLPKDGGPNTLMPHMSKMRFLGKMIAGSFQACVEDGKAREGAPYVRGGIALGRFMTQDDFLISYLVGQAIQEITLQKAAYFLPLMDKAALQELYSQLESLPAARPVSEILQSEGKMYQNWLRGKIAAGVDISTALKGMGIGDDQLLKMTPAQFQKELDALDTMYRETSAALNKPDAECRRELAALEEKLKKESGPLCKLMFPAVSRLHDAELRTQIHFLQLRAAIRVLLDGPEALVNFPDPVDGKPFTCTKTPEGFELYSRVMDQDKVVKLTVGTIWKDAKTETKTKVESAPKKPLPPPADF